MGCLFYVAGYFAVAFFAVLAVGVFLKVNPWVFWLLVGLVALVIILIVWGCIADKARGKNKRKPDPPKDLN